MLDYDYSNGYDYGEDQGYDQYAEQHDDSRALPPPPPPGPSVPSPQHADPTPAAADPYASSGLKKWERPWTLKELRDEEDWTLAADAGVSTNGNMPLPLAPTSLHLWQPNPFNSFDTID